MSANSTSENLAIEQYDRARQKWQRLLELFYQQIRYGCKNLSCEKPACRTCRSRLSDRRPYRVPTPAAAKHWASILACERNAPDLLCRGSLNPMSASDGAFKLQRTGDAFDSKSLVQQLFNTTSWHSSSRGSYHTKTFHPNIAEELLIVVELQRRRRKAFDDVVHTITTEVPSDPLDQLKGFRTYFESLVVHLNSPRDSLPYIPDNVVNLMVTTAGLLVAFMSSSLGKSFDTFEAAISDGPIFNAEISKIEPNFYGFIDVVENTVALSVAKKFLYSLDTMDLYDVFFNELQESKAPSEANYQSNLTLYRKLVVWVKLVFRNTWKSETIEIDRNGEAHLALKFLDKFRAFCIPDITPKAFPGSMGLVARSFDIIKDTVSWMKPSGGPDKVHLLNYTWLFGLRERLILFRSANYCLMLGAFEKAMEISQMVIRTHSTIREAALAQVRHQLIFERMKPALTAFLVLQIRRENILEDALHQLWRREQRELRRPLKIKMGMDMGEEGVDLGGVQQEFFRLAVGSALNPDLGFFDIDPTVQMAWFRPFSPAPLIQFALLGMLFGLACYNSITLPVTLPAYFYQLLLSSAQGRTASHDLETLQDGWPVVYRSLKSLLEYEGDDVEEVFALDFSFGLELTGRSVALNMAEPVPQDTNEILANEATTEGRDIKAVTSSNKLEYVRTYTDWLLNKSIKRQRDAFLRGFQSVVVGRTLSLFQDEYELKDAVEGSQVISVSELKQITKYLDGYTEKTQIIQDFWGIVEEYSQDELRRLLEFVTASERIPAAGIQDLSFIIQKNGSGDERLPTSMTCFGRLLMPHYSSKTVLKERLRVALENCEGFGVA